VDTADAVLAPSGVTPEMVSDPYAVMDYSRAATVLDSLFLNVDSLADLADASAGSADYDPLRLTGLYALQGRSRTMVEFWGRIQSVTRLLINGQDCRLNSTADEISIWSDWHGFQGIGLPVSALVFVARQVELLTGLAPVRLQLPVLQTVMLKERMTRELPDVDIRFTPGFAGLVYDREAALALPPLFSFGDPLSYSDLLRAYYPARYSDQAAHVNDVIEHLLFNEDEEPTVERVAAVAEVPALQLQRSISAGGLTLRAIIERIRIQHAEGLLADGDAPVIDVAMAVGYSSAQAFTKSFKRLRGLSPGEYRHYVRLNESGTSSAPAPAGR
jgi:AraC-like DNA-binding protein